MKHPHCNEIDFTRHNWQEINKYLEECKTYKKRAPVRVPAKVLKDFDSVDFALFDDVIRPD